MIFNKQQRNVSICVELLETNSKKKRHNCYIEITWLLLLHVIPTQLVPQGSEPFQFSGNLVHSLFKACKAEAAPIFKRNKYSYIWITRIIILVYLPSKPFVSAETEQIWQKVKIRSMQTWILERIFRTIVSQNTSRKSLVAKKTCTQ